MFNLLKKTLSNVVSKFSKSVEESEVESLKSEVKKEKESEVESLKSEVKKEAKESEVESLKSEVKKEAKESEVESLKSEVKKEAKESEVESLKSEVKKEAKESEVESLKSEVKKEAKESEVRSQKSEVKEKKAVEEKPHEKKPKEEVEEKPKPGFFAKLLGKKEELGEETPDSRLQTPDSQGFAEKLTGAFTKTKISEEKFEELFWDMEITLLQNNMARKVIEKIKEDLKGELVDKLIPRKGIAETINKSLEKSLNEILDFKVPDLMSFTDKKPLILLFVGINGSGKTTTIAKIAKRFQDNNKSCVLVAGDTFRAAAIQQLEEHANNLKTKIIKHDYGADPAAVAFDGVKYAEAHNIDVVLIDTAGRLHTNQNLMDELKKIKRVANPDKIIYVGESITGNDCIEQASKYNEAIGIDGVVLTKVDVDEKGGTPISIAYVTEKPIWLIGVGQNYEDLIPFDKAKILENLK